MEMRVELKGFLQDRSGAPIITAGQRISLAIGAEAASDDYGASAWGADSSPVIYGYPITMSQDKL